MKRSKRLPTYLTCLAISLVASSCDQAKKLKDQVMREVDSLRGVKSAPATNTAQKPKAVLPADDGKIDAKWDAMLDRTAEGVIFRKDLPFPTKVEVETTTLEEWDLRVMQAEALAAPNQVYHGTRTAVEKITRDAAGMYYGVESSTWEPISPPPAPAAGKGPPGAKMPAEAKNSGAKKAGGKVPEKATEPIEAQLPGMVTAPVKAAFQRVENHWVAEKPADFRAAVMIRQLEPFAEMLAVAHSTTPRTLWFSKRRFKAGDVIPVSEPLLAMLADGKILKGALSLTFEQIEGVAGHPCGRFAIHGTVRREEFPDPLNGGEKEERTIETGKIWLSAVYPVILKGEWKEILTREGAGARVQGAVNHRFVRKWKGE